MVLVLLAQKATRTGAEGWFLGVQGSQQYPVYQSDHRHRSGALRIPS